MEKYLIYIILIFLIIVSFSFGLLIHKKFLNLIRYNITIEKPQTSYLNCEELKKICYILSQKNLCLLKVTRINEFNNCECILRDCYKNETL